MSDLDNSAVVGCVAAIVSSYQDAAELLTDIEQRKHATGARQHGEVDHRASEDLGLSIARGQEVVRTQYERDCKRLGDSFATGDQMARETLKDIIVRLQKQVVSQLKSAWLNDTPVDYFALQDVSDDSQDRTIMVLMQLHQRLLVAAPIDVISAAARPSRPRASTTSGQPQGHIQGERTPFDGLPPSQQVYGNHVEISGGTTQSLEKKTVTRFIPGFGKKSSDEKDPRLPNMHSTARHFAPHESRYNRYYDNRRGEHFYDPHHADQKEPSDPGSYDDSVSDSARGHYRQESLQPPQRANKPFRNSMVSSVSSYGSGDQDRPDFNPWSDDVSPLSSITDEIAASNPHLSNNNHYQHNPLVPHALEPRRVRDSQQTQQTQHSRQTSATLNNPSDTTSSGSTEGYGNEYPEKFSKLLINDGDSVYSQHDDRSYQPSYYDSSTPNDNVRQHHIDASQNERPNDVWDRQEPARSRSPAYNIFPPQQPKRIVERTTSPLSSMPPMSPHSSSPLNHGYGPPPTAPPDRPIPNPKPRVPERAPNRPRGDSNLSRITSSHSPTTPQTPASTLNQIPINRPAADPAPSDSAPSATRVSPATTTYMASDLIFAGMTATPPVPKPKKQKTPTDLQRQDSVLSSSTSTSNPRAIAAAPVKLIPPMTTGSVKAYLPSEANKYAGFCKGAWRAQIGDNKKTWEERARPAGLYAGVNHYLRCQKCSFEGRSIRALGQKKGAPDQKIYGKDGIVYRWEFLFKSHVPEKSSKGPTESAYGCMFCCAEGKGTLVFQGVGALLAHLQEHKENPPTGEIVYRMHAIIGREPEPNEEFQVAIP